MGIYTGIWMVDGWMVDGWMDGCGGGMCRAVAW